MVDQTLLEGDYAVVTKQVWCMESKEALSELQDRAVRGSYEEMTRTYSRKGVATLELGDQVRVVDRRFGGAVKVRSASSDQACWTVPNALQKIGLAKQSKSRESERFRVVVPIPNGGIYTIIRTEVVPGIKRSLDIRLNRTVSEEVLRAIATKLKNSDHGTYERTFISYYLPGMKVGSGAWATSHFDPDLEICILGVSTDQEELLFPYQRPCQNWREWMPPSLAKNA